MSHVQLSYTLNFHSLRFFFLFPVVLETDPHHKFKISVKSEGSEPYADLTVEAAEITLHFEYTSTYPDEPPVMEVIPVENIEDEDLEGLRRELVTQVWYMTVFDFIFLILFVVL